MWFDGSDDDNTNDWHTGTHTSFSWQTVTVGWNQQPITFDLSSGTHVLHIGVREDGAKLKTVQIIGDAVISAMPCLRLAASRVCLDLGQLWSDPSVSIVVQVGLSSWAGGRKFCARSWSRADLASRNLSDPWAGIPGMCGRRCVLSRV